MFCDTCGAQLASGQKFCPNCGKSIPGAFAADTSQADGLRRHVQLLGILWLALSGVRLIPAIAMLGMLRSNYDFLPPDVPSFVPFVISFIGLAYLGGGLLGLAVGWGLLSWQPWARMTAIVVGCIGLLEIPFGTALGIYTLWALLPDAARREYEGRTLRGNGI